MCVCSEIAENALSSSSSGYSPSSGYEEHHRFRSGVDLSPPPSALDYSVAGVSPGKGVSYGKMRKSLSVLLKRLPSHDEIVEWMNKCLRAHHFCFYIQIKLIETDMRSHSSLECSKSLFGQAFLGFSSPYKEKVGPNTFVIKLFSRRSSFCSMYKIE